MKKSEFTKMKKILKEMLSQKIIFSKQNMLDNGITAEQIDEMRRAKIFGYDDDQIFVNWNRNKYDQNATLFIYEQNIKRSLEKKMMEVYLMIEQIAEEEDLCTTDLADLIENHFQFGD